MIRCPSCGKANGDGRRHCNWCGCYLPPLLREEDRATPWVPNTWSNLAMLKVEQELIESERRMRQAEPKMRLSESELRLVEDFIERGLGRAEPQLRLTDRGLVSVYDGEETQVFVNGHGNIVRVVR